MSPSAAASSGGLCTPYAPYTAYPHPQPACATRMPSPTLEAEVSPSRLPFVVLALLLLGIAVRWIAKGGLWLSRRRQLQVHALWKRSLASLPTRSRHLASLHDAVQRRDQAALAAFRAGFFSMPYRRHAGFVRTTAFHTAADTGDFDLFLALAERCRDQTAIAQLQVDGDTLLHHTANARNLDLLNWVLNHGADPSVVHARGFEPHFDAIRVRWVEGLIRLLDACPEVLEGRLVALFRCATDNASLSCAAVLVSRSSADQLKAVDPLSGNSLLHDCPLGLLETILLRVAGSGVVNHANILGETPLDRAVKNAQPEAVKLLLLHGAAVGPDAGRLMRTCALSASRLQQIGWNRVPIAAARVEARERCLLYLAAAGAAVSPCLQNLLLDCHQYAPSTLALLLSVGLLQNLEEQVADAHERLLQYLLAHAQDDLDLHLPGDPDGTRLRASLETALLQGACSSAALADLHVQGAAPTRGGHAFHAIYTTLAMYSPPAEDGPAVPRLEELAIKKFRSGDGLSGHANLWCAVLSSGLLPANLQDALLLDLSGSLRRMLLPHLATFESLRQCQPTPACC